MCHVATKALESLGYKAHLIPLCLACASKITQNAGLPCPGWEKLLLHSCGLTSLPQGLLRARSSPSVLLAWASLGSPVLWVRSSMLGSRWGPWGRLGKLWQGSHQGPWGRLSRMCIPCTTRNVLVQPSLGPGCFVLGVWLKSQSSVLQICSGFGFLIPFFSF